MQGLQTAQTDANTKSPNKYTQLQASKTSGSVTLSFISSLDKHTFPSKPRLRCLPQHLPTSPRHRHTPHTHTYIHKCTHTTHAHRCTLKKQRHPSSDLTNTPVIRPGVNVYSRQGQSVCCPSALAPKTAASLNTSARRSPNTRSSGTTSITSALRSRNLGAQFQTWVF